MSRKRFHGRVDRSAGADKCWPYKVNIRKTLEESNLPVEVATAIADLCESRQRPEADAIRNAAIEECAKVCDKHFRTWDGEVSVDAEREYAWMAAAAEHCAAAIRKLLRPQPGEGKT